MQHKSNWRIAPLNMDLARRTCKWCAAGDTPIKGARRSDGLGFEWYHGGRIGEKCTAQAIYNALEAQVLPPSGIS